MIFLCVISNLHKDILARRRSRAGTHQYDGPEGEINFAIDLKQLEEFLLRKDKELRADIDRMRLDFEAQAILEEIRKTIQEKLNDLETTVSELKAHLLGIYQALDDFNSDFEPEQVIQARKALKRWETSKVETLFKQALAMGKKIAAEASDSKPVLEMGNKKAAAASYQLGRLAESQFNHFSAAQYYHQAAELQPTNLTYLNAAAEFSFSLGEDYEAEAYLQRVLKMQQKLLGPEHPELAQTLNNLGALRHTQGRYKEAEALYRWALEIYEPSLNANHPDVVTLLENYAALLREVGRIKEIGPIKSRFAIT